MTQTGTTWRVTIRTAESTWSTVSVEAGDHLKATASARRLLGNGPVTRIV
jgi:hypothetical protein